MTTSSLSIAAQQTNEQYNIEYNDQLQFLSLKASLLNLAPENLEALQNDVQQLVNRNPDFQDAQFLLSSILSIRANWVQIEEAVAHEVSSTILKGKEESNELNALFWFAKAMMISPRATTPRSGDAKQALKYFDKAYRLEPHDTLILEWYILILHMAGQADYAKQLAEDKLERDPFNSTLLDGLAMYHYAHGQYDLSRKYALRLSAVDQLSPEGPNRLAYIHIVKNEIVDADVQAQECLERSIRFMNCWVHKAEVHENAGEKQILNHIYEVMKKLAPPVTKAMTLHQLNHSESVDKIKRIEAYLSSVKEYDFNVGFFSQVYLYALTQVPNGQQARYVDLALSKVSGGQALLFRRLLYPNDVSNELPIVEEVTRALENKQRSRYYDYYLAQLYTQMGQYDDALNILANLINNSAVPASFERFYGIESDPFLKRMKEIPRFRMLLEKQEENKLALKLAISDTNKTTNLIERAKAL
jgi:tetratricopeptide (TPR) repeat protein